MGCFDAPSPHGNFAVKTGEDHSTVFGASCVTFVSVACPGVFFLHLISIWIDVWDFENLSSVVAAFFTSVQKSRRPIACCVRTVGSSRGVNSAQTHLLVG